jgi:hypothetical protein
VRSRSTKDEEEFTTEVAEGHRGSGDGRAKSDDFIIEILRSED